MPIYISWLKNIFNETLFHSKEAHKTSCTYSYWQVQGVVPAWQVIVINHSRYSFRRNSAMTTQDRLYQHRSAHYSAELKSEGKNIS